MESNGKLNISQSLISSFKKYKAGDECGEYIKLVTIENKVKTKSSESMEMGTRFEFEALGNKDYYGNVPRMFLNQNGTYSKKQTIISAQAENFKAWMEKHGNIKIESGERKVVERDEYNLSFMRDLVYKTKDGTKLIVCDLKMSGNLGNKESEWGWHEDTLLSHDYKLTQVMLYVIASIELGEKVDAFVFYVASSRDENEYQVFWIDISEEAIEKWKGIIDELAREIVFEYTVTGFTPRPGKRCVDCVAKDICQYYNADAVNGYVKLKL
jgi:hypothetical protein